MGKTVAAIVGVVAAIAIAVVAPYLAPAVAGFLGVSTAVATAIVTVGLSLAVSLAMSVAFKGLGVGAPSAKDAVGPPQVFRQAISNSFIVYGKRRVGGLIVFFHSRQVGSDHFRYFVIACAGHRCKGVVSWMLGDEVVTVDGSGAVTSGKYAGAAWLWFQRGLASETANATFVAECGGNWTTSHKGNGVAAIYAKFKMTDAAVQAGMPNITAVIEGRDEILDPRDSSIGYKNNAVLVLYDWMQIPREEGGFGAYPDEIPDASWISAQANVCDETVAGEPRYRLDGVIQTGASPAEVRDAMIVNMAGEYSYSGGKHLIRPGYWVPVSATLSEDDLAGPIQISPFVPADAAANEVQGTFIDPDTNYQGAALTTWRRSPAPADVRQIDVDLAFTTSRKQGDRILAIMGRRAECEKTVTWPMNIAGVKVKALDTVQLACSRYGLDNYAWRVANWGLSSDWGVVQSLREENADIYADDAPATPSATPSVVVPSAPLDTTAATMAKIVQSSVDGLTFSVAADGSATISAHTRIYDDRTVSVNGGSTPAIPGIATGDIVAIVYRQSSRIGGAVTYESGRFVAGDDLPKPHAGDPYLHPVAVGVVQSTGTFDGGSGVGSGGGAGGGGGGWNNVDPTREL